MNFINGILITTYSIKLQLMDIIHINANHNNSYKGETYPS